MAANDCVNQQVDFRLAVNKYNDIANAAESINWASLGTTSLIGAGSTAAAMVATWKTTAPPLVVGGSVVGPEGAAAGLATANTATIGTGLVGAVGTGLALLGVLGNDILERTKVDAAADNVADAFDSLQECRECHKNEDDDSPFGSPNSFLNGVAIIPFEDPDPNDAGGDQFPPPGSDDDPELDEIIIFDELEGADIVEEDDDLIIIIDDE